MILLTAATKTEQFSFSKTFAQNRSNPADCAATTAISVTRIFVLRSD
jgi:hypothetical protein